MRQYIGARYVPKFMGTYDATQAYEALCVVDNGMGTSYISKVPTPANTPLTDTNYWAIYGASSGAIINLQDQIDDMKDGTVPGSLQDQINTNATNISSLNTAINNIPVKRKYVLIGDSFGVGIIDSVTPWTTGWEDYFKALLPNDVFYFDPQNDPGFSGAGGFTTTGQYNFTDQLQYIHDNLMGTTSANEITDVVVLGGSNEIGSVSDIVTAIDIFFTRSRSLYPNANIALGCVGLHARKMVANNAYSGYSRGAAKNGGAFYSELLNLGASNTYDSGLGHWTAAGYAVFNPIIAKCIVSGHTNYYFEEYLSLTPLSDITVPGSVTINLALRRTEKGVFARVYNTTNYIGWYVKNAKTIGPGVHTVNAFEYSGSFYPSVLSGGSVDPTLYCFNVSTNAIDTNACKMSLILDNGGNNQSHLITMSTFRRLSYVQTDDMAFSWNGSYANKLDGAETY